MFTSYYEPISHTGDVEKRNVTVPRARAVQAQRVNGADCPAVARAGERRKPGNGSGKTCFTFI
jgi:hypothetical protein